MVEPSTSARVNSLSNRIRTAPPFVGRREELAWLESILQEVLAGHPRVVLLPGEAGIGKTRLLQELRSGALRRGLQVGYGRGYEDLTLPYLPFIESLHTLLDRDLHDVEGLVGADLEVLRWLLHRDQNSAHVAHPFTLTQSDQDKLRLFFAVAHAAIGLAQRCPTILIVDDLHWVDRSSLDLFGHLVFTVTDLAMREPVPLLIIGSYRPVEAETPLGRLIARVQRELICRTFTLPGLNESEIQRLVQGLGLLRPSHQLIATVSEATQGNPLFIQEVLYHLMQRQALQERGGYVVATAAATDLQLPEQITGAIVMRTRELSADSRRVLTLASFLSDGFAVQTLSAVSGLSEDELLTLLVEGMRHRLLLSDGEAFRFAHPLIRHVFYQEPTQVRRQHIHQQIAETLERQYASDLDAHILEIAHHLIRAGSAAAASKVVEYARRAGDQAFELFAWGEAARHYEAVLRAGEFNGQISMQERAELHYWAGLAHYRDQDVGPCLDHYEKSIEAYRLLGDVRGLAQVLIDKTEPQWTLASVPLGTLADLQPLEEVLEALGENEPGLCARILATMAEAHRNARQTAKAKEMAQRALAIGQRLKDDQLCARASSALALAHISNLHVPEALESWQNALAHARQANDLWLEGWPLQRMPLALTLRGQFDKAEAVALEACALTRKTQDWGEGYSVALSHLTSVAVARGDFPAAEQRAQETMLMVYRSSYPWGGARSLFALACARALHGAYAEAEDALNILVEPGHVFKEAGSIIQTFVQAFRRLLRAYSDRVDEAIEPFAGELMRAVRTDTYSLAPLCALVEIGDLLAAPSVVEHPYQALSRTADQGIFFSSGWMFLIPRILGVAAGLIRRWDAAEAHFHVAIDMATNAGALPELGRAYLDYAYMLKARDGRSGRRRAIELLSQAFPIFRKLGMAPFTKRAEQLAKALKARIPREPLAHPAYPDNLSEREVAVLLEVAQGRTIKEIADNLMLSSQSVGHHLNSLFNKVGVNSQRAAEAYVSRWGLASQTQPRGMTKATAAHERRSNRSKTQPLHIIMVTDMEASAAIIQRWGDAKAHELLRLHNSIIRECLRRYHGVEITHTGDGVEVSFSSPANAATCAVAIQKAFAKYNQEHPGHPMRVRIGLNAGEPISTEGRLFGAAVHTTFRICARARPGQILASDVIHRLVAGKGFDFIDRGRVVLKGFRGRMRLYEVRWENETAEQQV